ncbi:MAG: hypothetical protein KAH20_16820 [Methylococcales bacterium]|nr:hypothetical protein [Methylococcales bacterium]
MVKRSYDGHEVERMPTINALTSYGDILFASTTDNKLLRTNTDWINESDTWQRVHHCYFSVGLAVVQWMLFVVTREGRIWRMDLSGLGGSS